MSITRKAITTTIQKILQSLVSYKIFLKFYFLIILIGSLSRTILLLATQTSSDIGLILLYGIRMDTIVFSFLSILLILFYIFNMLKLFRFLISFVVSLYVSFVIVSILFFGKFMMQPNYMFVEYLTHINEVFNTIFELYTAAFFALIVTFLLSLYFISKYIHKELSEENISTKLITFPIVIVILFLGLRSGIDASTPNPSFYTFSNQPIKNEIANNPLFSVLYAIHKQKDDEKYNFMSNTESIKNSQRIMLEEFQDTQSLTRELKSNFPQKNVILVILESFGSGYTAHLGGKNATPKLDSLQSEALVFDNLYASGSRTHWGISAVLTSMNPPFNTSYLKLPNSQKEFYTIARSFRKNGYENIFMYGGDSSFDNMSGFLMGNGYDKIYDKFDFGLTVTDSTWGYSDEKLYDKVYTVVKEQTKPYFITVMTLSSHEPFDYPQGRVNLIQKEPKNGFANAIHYADNEFYKFYSKLKSSGILKNTIVAVVGDHGAGIADKNTSKMIQKNKVVAMIFSDDLKNQRYKPIASQIDFGITLLDSSGINDKLNCSGQSIFKAQRNNALMIQNDQAYLIDKKGFIAIDKNSLKSTCHNDDKTCKVRIKNALSTLQSANIIYQSSSSVVK